MLGEFNGKLLSMWHGLKFEVALSSNLTRLEVFVVNFALYTIRISAPCCSWARIGFNVVTPLHVYHAGDARWDKKTIFRFSSFCIASLRTYTRSHRAGGARMYLQIWLWSININISCMGGEWKKMKNIIQMRIFLLLLPLLSSIALHTPRVPPPESQKNVYKFE